MNSGHELGALLRLFPWSGPDVLPRRVMWGLKCEFTRAVGSGLRYCLYLQLWVHQRGLCAKQWQGRPLFMQGSEVLVVLEVGPIPNRIL